MRNHILSTGRKLKLSSSSSLTQVIDLSLNLLTLRVMWLLLLAGEPEMLTQEVETFNLTSGTRSLPSAPFFKIGTSLFLTMGATEVGREHAIEGQKRKSEVRYETHCGERK